MGRKPKAETAAQTNFVDVAEPDRKKAEEQIRKLEREVRDDTYSMKENLKKSKAYLRLLKDSGLTADDVYFRCHQPGLAVSHLTLAAQQAGELGANFQEIAKTLEKIEENKAEIKALCDKHGIVLDQIDEYSDDEDEWEDEESEEEESEELEQKGTEILNEAGADENGQPM